jgi:hypothetical protein
MAPVAATMERPSPAGTGLVARLRSLALQALARMYRPEERLFVFRLRRGPRGQVLPEGLSRRYTAIALIGLAGEGEAAARPVLNGHGPHDVCGRLMAEVVRSTNLGDVALTLWAAAAVGYPDRRWAWDRLVELAPAHRPHPVVELAWTLLALCASDEPPGNGLRDRVADRLLAAFQSRSALFPHLAGVNGRGGRSHVACFADLVYPVHALTRYFEVSGNEAALDAARRCAERVCRAQGPAGQWWWHWDVRTGAVIEPYPVYAVHQDAMAPMAFLGLQDAAGGDFARPVARGLAWLASAPELGGGSLVDPGAGLIWRKVARREPRKLSRYLQALASRLHPALRVPGVDLAFPPGAVDHEDRPYHAGWVLHAWPRERAAQWDAVESP